MRSSKWVRLTLGRTSTFLLVLGALAAADWLAATAFRTASPPAGAREDWAAGAGRAATPDPLKLTTPAFQPGGDIPREFTCEGGDESPELSWSGAPAGTKSFALIADDPDAPAGTWVHWVIFDLPAETQHLPRGVPKQADVQGGGHQGNNDFDRVGYGGPCPPPGKAHRYFFKLYALDIQLHLKAGATKRDVERTMRGHILTQAELIGRYKR